MRTIVVADLLVFIRMWTLNVLLHSLAITMTLSQDSFFVYYMSRGELVISLTSAFWNCYSDFPPGGARDRTADHTLVNVG